MTELTTHERMTRILNHREADRCPITDDPWGATLERWHREGLPEGVYFGEYLGLDRVVTIGADNSPRYPAQVIQETDEWTERTTSWGTRIREWKHAGGVPEFAYALKSKPNPINEVLTSKQEAALGLTTGGLILFIVLLLVCLPLCWLPWVIDSTRAR